jgi:dolichol kinase/drug/metabolite transporter superfamily protein YnfA
MPLIEWTCVAGLPTVLCLQIIIAHTNTHITPTALSWLDFVSVQSTTTWDLEPSFHWPIFLLVATSILSLVAILVYGDTPASEKVNNLREHNKRGEGIVMGSHLVPLLYMALLLFVSPFRSGLNLTSCRGSYALDSIHNNFDGGSCPDLIRRVATVERILHHLIFSTFGGISFVFSFLWMKMLPTCNHRTFNKRRTNGHIERRSGTSLHHPSERVTPLMKICWRIYLPLLIIHSTICAFRSDHDCITTLLGISHLLLIMVYDNNREGVCHWQDAFTPGEWMVVSTLLSSLVGEYLIAYSGLFCSSEPWSSQVNGAMPVHLTVAHAGLSGCLVGVAVCSFLDRMMAWKGYVQRSIGVVASLMVVLGVAMGCIQAALNSQSISSDSYCDLESTSCATFTISTSTINWLSVPYPFQWLLHFLLSKIDVPYFDGDTRICRAAVLVYWSSILAVCLPVASILPFWITSTRSRDFINTNKNNQASTTQIQNHGDRARTKRIIIARKYFHLVAILLFTPITWLDPDMISLSYAIAIALLVIIEMIRGRMGTYCSTIEHTILGTDTTNVLNRFYVAFLDEKDASAAKGGLAVTHIALVFGCAFPLWVHQCLQKEPILSSAKGSIVQLDKNCLMALLPFLGLIILGVGDSISAIIGVNFGRRHWPGGSSRTIEGSVCMFLSMVGTVMLHAGYQRFTELANCSFETSVVMAVISLIEASTSQVDNLYLPLAGSTLVLLSTVLKVPHHNMT